MQKSYCEAILDGFLFVTMRIPNSYKTKKIIIFLLYFVDWFTFRVMNVTIIEK